MRKGDSCNLARNCLKSSVVVKPEKGKAILWYSHVRRRATRWLGELDPYSSHGGCDVIKGQKWIANNWVNVSPIRAHDIENFAMMAYEKRKKEKKEQSEGKEKQTDEPRAGNIAEIPLYPENESVKSELSYYI